MTNQKWATPYEFTAAVERRYGKIGFDLAASRSNTKAPAYFHEKQNALVQDWTDLKTDKGFAPRVVWLNPPFANIDPWAEKLANECRDLPRWTLMLVPASMATRWWAAFVLNKAYVAGIIPRLKFIGAKDPYPKDLALCCYGFGVSGTGFWDWNPGKARKTRKAR